MTTKTKPKPSTKSKTRILIVDDHPLVRRGLRELISTEPDLIVCGEAGEAPEAMVLVDRLQPQLALIDISLKRGHGLELIRQISARNPSIKMLVISMHDESLFAERALRAGALGYINKQDVTIKVAEAIRTVLAGQLYLSPAMAQRLLKQAGQLRSASESSSMTSLSGRELAVFELLGNGLTTRAIAAKLQLSIKTIETHREHIKSKLQLKNNNELIRTAAQWVLE